MLTLMFHLSNLAKGEMTLSSYNAIMTGDVGNARDCAARQRGCVSRQAERTRFGSPPSPFMRERAAWARNIVGSWLVHDPCLIEPVPDMVFVTCDGEP